MSVQPTTTQELKENIVAQIESTTNQSVPPLPKAAIPVTAAAMAATYIQLYKYIGFGINQFFVSTASSEATIINGETIVPLVEIGREIGVGDPAPAVQAELVINVVNNQPGAVLPAGSQLVYTPTGVTYFTLTAITLTDPLEPVVVRAFSDPAGGNGAGAIGNVPNGEQLSFVNALASVGRLAEVVSTATQGADGEDLEVYRQRVLDRFQARPQGGAYADYRLWGQEPAGIVNIYPYTSPTCPGQVDVYAEATPESSGDPDGIPTPAQLQEVKDAIELDENGLATRRPAGALVLVLEISRVPFDVFINDLDPGTEDLAQVQADIEQALTDYFLEREPYIEGLSIAPRLDRITQTAVGGVIDDIVAAAGGIFSSVTLEVNSVQTPSVDLGFGEKAKLNSITYSP